MTRGLGRVGLVVQQGFLTARARLALWTNSTAHQDIQGRINASPRPCLWTKIQISWKKNPEILKNDFLFFNFIKILPFFFKRDEVVKGFFLFWTKISEIWFLYKGNIYLQIFKQNRIFFQLYKKNYPSWTSKFVFRNFVFYQKMSI